VDAGAAADGAPQTGGYFQLRQAGRIWLNNWLGMLLDTTGQPKGLNRISVKLFAAESPATEIGHFTDAGRSATIMIDNTTPIGNLQQIYQQPGNVPIGACGLVTSGAPTFTFLITAAAPQQHLAGWSLTAYWGDNRSATVGGDPTSTHCAHSFFVYAWDRVINGYSFIHGAAGGNCAEECVGDGGVSARPCTFFQCRLLTKRRSPSFVALHQNPSKVPPHKD
jgi:hypothetical protein